MGLRAINNPNSSFEDPYANTGTEASIEWQPPKWYGDRGCFGGGYTGSDQNVIGYVTISSTGDASDFGDLTQARYGSAATSNSVRGVWGGGNTVPAQVDTIDFLNINNGGTGTDFGNLTGVRGNLGCGGNGHGGLNDGYQGYGARH